MYAIKDELNGYTAPIPIMSDDIAKRYFREQYNGNPTIKSSAKDFSIWRTGIFDTETGKYEAENENVLIERAEQYAE